MRALLLVLLFAPTAHAELPTIESEHPPTLRITTDDWATRIERVALSIHGAPETTWLTITLAGRTDRFTSLAISVPEGTRVFGLGVAEERGSVWGRPMLVDEAHHRHRTVEVSALLSWNGTSADQDHYRLGVQTPATIELALLLPPLARLAVDTNAGLTRVEVNGARRFVAKRSRRRQVVDLGDIAGTTDACPRCASDEIALLAAKAPVTDFLEPVPAFHHRPFVSRDIDKTIIRRYMKRHRAQLRQCYMQVAQWDPSIKGGATLSFLITSEGMVATARATESDLPASVTNCLVANVLRWEFPAADGNVQVNYPLEFRLAD